MEPGREPWYRFAGRGGDFFGLGPRLSYLMSWLCRLTTKSLESFPVSDCLGDASGGLCGLLGPAMLVDSARQGGSLAIERGCDWYLCWRQLAWVGAPCGGSALATTVGRLALKGDGWTFLARRAYSSGLCFFCETDCSLALALLLCESLFSFTWASSSRDLPSARWICPWL